MRVLVTGSSGLVGSELMQRLQGRGDTAARLVRSRNLNHGSIYWNIDEGEIDAAQLEGFDAIVHLAGDSIADGRWNDAKKKRIRDSRVTGTTLLAETIAGLSQKPKVFVCASAIGFYGDRGDETLTEESTTGEGFLPDVSRAWESACEPAAKAGVRVVNVRIGVVLSPKGGALQKMLTPFKLGAGGRLGSGKQYMSWISLTDVAGAILHVLEHDVSGPVNAVAPQPVTNLEFTKTLGRVLGRPTIFPMPAPIVRIAFGQMGQDLLLASTRVVPNVLQKSGYEFSHATLEDALRAELGKGK